MGKGSEREFWGGVGVDVFWRGVVRAYGKISSWNMTSREMKKSCDSIS